METQEFIVKTCDGNFLFKKKCSKVNMQSKERWNISQKHKYKILSAKY